MRKERVTCLEFRFLKFYEALWRMVCVRMRHDGCGPGIGNEYGRCLQSIKHICANQVFGRSETAADRRSRTAVFCQKRRSGFSVYFRKCLIGGKSAEKMRIRPCADVDGRVWKGSGNIARCRALIKHFFRLLGVRTKSWTFWRPDWSSHVFDGGSAQGR